MARIHALLFLAEAIVVGLVIAIFRIIENRIVAGAVAGSVFVLLGALIVGLVWSKGGRWKALSLYAGSVHLFWVALPLLITRMMNTSMPFDSMYVWGLPGPVFHKISNYVYLVMMATTAVDWVRAGFGGLKSLRS